MAESLLELSHQYRELIDMLDDPETDAEVLEDTLDGFMGVIESKVDACCYIMDTLENRSDFLEQQIDRLKAQKDHIDRQKSNLSNRMMCAMDLMGKDTITSDLYKVHIRKNGGVLPLIIKGEVPAEFKKVVVEQRDDNAKIRDYLKKHPECEWATLGQRGRRLTYK